jgi:HD-GYP domain-containing protein (c-di-GMP phosphodiesterase class II)
MHLHKRVIQAAEQAQVAILIVCLGLVLALTGALAPTDWAAVVVALVSILVVLSLTWIKRFGEKRGTSEEDAVIALSEKYDHLLSSLNAGLEEEIGHRLHQSLVANQALIFGLAKLADYRDGETGAHLERLCRYTEILANEMRSDYEEIDEEWIASLRLATALHDIGKVGVPDSILLKPARLTDAEREVIKRHTSIGGETLREIRERLGENQMIDMGIDVTMQHHERWDGEGYPAGLKGDEIALAARIVALADFYDALTSERVYKSASTHAETRKLINEGRGKHFDPRVVDAFERTHKMFDEVRGVLRGEIDVMRLEVEADLGREAA